MCIFLVEFFLYKKELIKSPNVRKKEKNSRQANFLERPITLFILKQNLDD